MAAPLPFDVGRVWKRRDASAWLDPSDIPSRATAFARGMAALARRRPRSVIVVGEAGVGTELFARALAVERHRKGDQVLEATPSEAGTEYISQLESGWPTW